MHMTSALSFLAVGATMVSAAPRLAPLYPRQNSTSTTLNLGKCTDPGIVFGAGFDGRKENSFEPRDRTEFTHASALNIGVITGFIADRLNDECAAPADTVSAARSAASSLTGLTGQAAADAWNKALGVATGGNSSSVAVTTAAAVATNTTVSTTSTTPCKKATTTTQAVSTTPCTKASATAVAASGSGSSSSGSGSSGSSSSGSSSSGSSSSGSSSSGSSSSGSSSSGSSSSGSSSSGSSSSGSSSSGSSSSGSSSSGSSSSGSSSSGSSSSGSSNSGSSSSASSSSSAVKSKCTSVTGAGAAGSNNNVATSTSASSAAATCDPTLQLLASNVQNGTQSTGLVNGTLEAGQSASNTDNANFINFCTGKTLTNGLQVKTGSCNGVVMGDIPSTDNMISAIIVNPLPAGMSSLKANTTFNIQVQLQGLVAGSFTNAATTYYSAPQELKNGQIVGHTHVTVQDMGKNIVPTTPMDPKKFVFFKGINDAGNGQGLLSATVTGGLPAGNYRVCTMTSASNHQPALMPVAQRGAQDDCTKFTVN